MGRSTSERPNKMKMDARRRYASVHGLEMCSEIHGPGRRHRPAVEDRTYGGRDHCFAASDGIENADFSGYSMGAGIGLHTALRHLDLLRKLVVASVSYNNNGTTRTPGWNGRSDTRSRAWNSLAGRICRPGAETERRVKPDLKGERLEFTHPGPGVLIQINLI
jgi:pimeloyl-ACP methyl ester carboxylesterase